ncbi:hypothetical protein CPC16_007122 [Podila verticillata]|nr:hypothetical protein CPC16_007122 [Podila verticillata]KAI9241510.1 MAG: hypothetical protein BYD32DRAFT_405748 [Podila humilis]
MASTTPKQPRPDHLVLRPMTDADKPEVAELFASTFQREPLGAYCGVTVKEGRGVAEASMVDPVSFVIEDPTLPGPGRLIAFRTSSILTKALLTTKKPETARDENSPVQQILEHMKDMWLAKTTVFTTNPDAKVMKFIALGVDTRYEGLGLAKELLNKAMDKARETGCTAVMVVASAFATQHLFGKRLGFELMGQVRYSEFLSKDGKKPFENLHEPEFLQIYEKKLE